MPKQAKNFFLDKIKHTHGLEHIEFHEGNSFTLDCRFYKTKEENIIITDYDFKNKKDLEDKGLFMLFNFRLIKGYRHTLVVTKEVIEEQSIFEEILKHFKNKINN